MSAPLPNRSHFYDVSAPSDSRSLGHLEAPGAEVSTEVSTEAWDASQQSSYAWAQMPLSASVEQAAGRGSSDIPGIHRAAGEMSRFSATVDHLGLRIARRRRVPSIHLDFLAQVLLQVGQRTITIASLIWPTFPTNERTLALKSLLYHEAAGNLYVYPPVSAWVPSATEDQIEVALCSATVFPFRPLAGRVTAPTAVSQSTLMREALEDLLGEDSATVLIREEVRHALCPESDPEVLLLDISRLCLWVFEVEDHDCDSGAKIVIGQWPEYLAKRLALSQMRR